MNAEGRCLCSAVTFIAEGMAAELHVCHCSMCRRWTGGPTFSAEARSVVFRGEENIQRYDSSAWAERGFCKRCGSSLFYRLKETNSYILNMGSFDDQQVFKIASEIYVDDKPAGYDFAGDHPRLTGEEFLASLQKE
jgi:hypothetical protein